MNQGENPADGRDEEYAAIERYAARLLRDPERARDVTQETALRRQTLGAEIPPTGMRAWLYRVARNLCIDILRKERRMQLTADPENAEVLYGHPHTRGFGQDPARVAEEREEREIMLKHVEDLPARQREVLRLKFQENLSYAEIAEVTGETTGMVGWLLHEALKVLRTQMA